MNNTVAEVKDENYRITGPELIKIEDIPKIGLDYTALTMKEIEIDYLCSSLPSITL